MSVLRLGRSALAVWCTLDHRSIEPATDHHQHCTVRNSPRHTAHQITVGNGVEVVGQVSVDNFSRPTIGNAEMNASERHLRIKPSAKAVLPRKQVRFENRTDYQQHCHLRHPIPYARNAEWTLATIGLGNPYAQQGPRLVSLRLQLLPQSFQPRASPVFLNVLETFAIDTRRPAIGAAASSGFLENVLATHLVPQAVETGSRFVLGFRLQCGL